MTFGWYKNNVSNALVKAVSIAAGLVYYHPNTEQDHCSAVKAETFLATHTKIEIGQPCET